MQQQYATFFAENCYTPELKNVSQCCSNIINMYLLRAQGTQERPKHLNRQPFVEAIY